MLETTNLYAGYGALDVIHNICFTAERGRILCILGPNGCGKSTLLKAIARVAFYRGSVKIDGIDTHTFSRKALAKKIALMGQSAQIYFPYTVRETVMLGRYAYSEGLFRNASAEDEAVVSDTLATLDITDIQHRMIDELSGGQLQRVFLAKTLVQNPDVILLDEPTNHLDLKNQIELLQHLVSWTRERQRIFIGAFHDLNLVHCFGDKAVLMHQGTIAAQGGIEETLHGSILERVYGIDIRAFMLASLRKWQGE